MKHRRGCIPDCINSLLFLKYRYVAIQLHHLPIHISISFPQVYRGLYYIQLHYFYRIHLTCVSSILSQKHHQVSIVLNEFVQVFYSKFLETGEANTVVLKKVTCKYCSHRQERAETVTAVRNRKKSELLVLRLSLLHKVTCY